MSRRRPRFFRRVAMPTVTALTVCLGLPMPLRGTAAEPVKPGASADSAQVFPAKGELTRAVSRSLMHDGVERQYLLQPVAGASDAPAGRRPVVLLLHGGTQTAETVWGQTSLPTLGITQGFILVAPQGLGRHWNDGRGSTIAGDSASSADDIGFLRAVIDDVVAHAHGDRDAVFMVGASNGGFMVMHFACAGGSELRAAAALIADLPTAEVAHCRTPRPLPWLQVNATDDPIMPFAGQPAGRVERGQVQPGLLSADRTFAFWAERAGCGPAVVERRIGQAERRERQGCGGGAASVQYVLHGSGHVWPGLAIRSWLVRRVLGEPNLDVDSGSLIWDHFRATLNGR
jgi:polyhydroxybutyrate depolymerase